VAHNRNGSARGKRPAGPPERVNIYDEVTQRIIGELEAGTVPWVRPWRKAAIGTSGLPVNATTGRAYSGINVLILWGAVIAADYPTQCWLTFRQALDAGGSVRKGEKGTGIVYADRFVPRDPKGALRGSDSADRAEKTRAAEQGGDGVGDKAGVRGTDTPRRAVPFLKRFTVFNAAQCDGLPEHLTQAPPPVPERETLPRAEAVIAASGIRFRLGGNHAFYAPGPDVVQMPPPPAFDEPLDFYRIGLHELNHATGHPARLARNQTGAFGTKDYAREELVAEMGAAFLCAALGIAPTLRHADYLANWLAVLREDNRAIFRAASAASKAADWLLSRPGAMIEADVQQAVAA